MVEGSAVDCPSNLGKRGELLDSIRDDRLVVVTGTGVSLHAVGHPAPGTEVAGWPGLLHHGLKHCVSLQLLDADEATIVDLQIRKDDPEHLIAAAQKIHSCIDRQAGNGRYWWLKESIGQLKLVEPRLIRAIQDLGGLVATLNYDNLLEEVTGRPPIHWRQQAEITGYIRRRSKEFILHMHGWWEVPESIILDQKSYQEIAADSDMQELLRNFARFETMLFVGCGNTFFDPNFQKLLEWASRALESAKHRHFILCRQCEEPHILAALQSRAYLTPIVYGKEYEDLTAYLETLGGESGSAAAAVNPPVVSKVGLGSGAPARLIKPADVWNLQSRR
jgi:SIR2-like domain